MLKECMSELIENSSRFPTTNIAKDSMYCVQRERERERERESEQHSNEPSVVVCVIWLQVSEEEQNL